MKLMLRIVLSAGALLFVGMGLDTVIGTIFGPWNGWDFVAMMVWSAGFTMVTGAFSLILLCIIDECFAEQPSEGKVRKIG